MTPDPPDAAERLSDEQVEIWIREMDRGVFELYLWRAKFLREALTFRTRLNDPATWESAVDAAGMASQQERTRQRAGGLDRVNIAGMDFDKIKAAEAAAIRRAVLGTEEA